MTITLQHLPTLAKRVHTIPLSCSLSDTFQFTSIPGVFKPVASWEDGQVGIEFPEGEGTIVIGFTISWSMYGMKSISAVFV